jgi:hypothetical protein
MYVISMLSRDTNCLDESECGEFRLGSSLQVCTTPSLGGGFGGDDEQQRRHLYPNGRQLPSLTLNY